MTEQQWTTLTAEEVAPTATVTAEINQTAAGAWRGSVKVSVTAPITFRSHVYEDEPYEQVFARIDAVAEQEQAGGAFAEVSTRPLAAFVPGQEPVAFVTAPTTREYEMREVVQRMLYDAALTVRVMADTYNAEAGMDVSVKPKGAK